MAKHILQDAAVLELVELVERVDPADQRHPLEAAVRGHNLRHKPLARLEVAVQAANRDLLAALETERLPRGAFLEHKRNDAHSDQVGTVDALERLRNDSPH